MVLAEGLAVESYLDTGNRADFANGGPVVALHPGFAAGVWGERAVVPLVVEGAVVEGVRRQLLARAAVLGWRVVADAGLVLEVGGVLVRPRWEEGWAVFRVPGGAGEGVLRSRVFVPAHGDAGSADWRRLGVAVSGMRLDGVAVEAGVLRGGWHAVEAGFRWTDGAGGIALGGARWLEVRLGPGGRY